MSDKLAGEGLVLKLLGLANWSACTESSSLGRRKPKLGQLARPRPKLVQPSLAAFAPSGVNLSQQARIAADAIGVIGIAGAILGEGGAVLAANKDFTTLLPELLRKTGERARFVERTADVTITEAFRRLQASRLPQVVSIHGENGVVAAVSYLVPFAGQATPANPITLALLAVIPLRLPHAPGAEILQKLFGLSPAEARVADAIASRKTVAAIAHDFGISRETVRSQLKTALAKTGAKRQLDLAVLLCNLPVLKPWDVHPK